MKQIFKKLGILSLFSLVFVLNGCISVNTDYVSKFNHSNDTWWKPKNNADITWQWQLSGDIDTTLDVYMYDVDLFDTSKATIDSLHEKDKIVTCYFSAGSLEYGSDRPDEIILTTIHPNVIGNTLENWEKERWLDITNKEVWDVMENRIALAKEKGCDAVEPDNVNAFEVDDDEPMENPIEDTDGYTTGFSITYKQQLNYNRFLASTAHKYNLSIALKNDVYQAVDLVNPSAPNKQDDFDWALNEMCYQYSTEDYDECSYYDVFDKANKAVFGVEYNGYINSFCSKANEKGRYWLKKHMSLDKWQKSCLEY